VTWRRQEPVKRELKRRHIKPAPAITMGGPAPGAAPAPDRPWLPAALPVVPEPKSRTWAGRELAACN
jgi:hypothetical protein